MTTLAAVQRTLAAEHAAVYVYGALGAQTSQSSAPALYATITSAYAVHRARRDHLVSAVTDLGGDPVASATSYDLPARLGTPEQVGRPAPAQEEASAATYASQVANTASPKMRRRVTSARCTNPSGTWSSGRSCPVPRATVRAISS